MRQKKTAERSLQSLTTHPPWNPPSLKTFINKPLIRQRLFPEPVQHEPERAESYSEHSSSYGFSQRKQRETERDRERRRDTERDGQQTEKTQKRTRKSPDLRSIWVVFEFKKGPREGPGR